MSTVLDREKTFSDYKPEDNTEGTKSLKSVVSAVSEVKSPLMDLPEVS